MLATQIYFNSVPQAGYQKHKSVRERSEDALPSGRLVAT